MTFNKFGMKFDRGRSNNSTQETALAHHRYTNTSDTLDTIAAAGYFPDYCNGRTDEVKIGDLVTIHGSNDYRSYKFTSVAPVVIVEEVLGDNPFDQSLNTGDSVTFANVTVTNTFATNVLSFVTATGSTLNLITLNVTDIVVTQGITLPSPGGTPATFDYYGFTDNVPLTLGGAMAGTVNVDFTRIGRMVFCRIPQIPGVAAVGAFSNISMLNIPTEYQWSSAGTSVDLNYPVLCIDNGNEIIASLQVEQGFEEGFRIFKVGAGNWTGTIGFEGATICWTQGL